MQGCAKKGAYHLGAPRKEIFSQERNHFCDELFAENDCERHEN